MKEYKFPLINEKICNVLILCFLLIPVISVVVIRYSDFGYLILFLLFFPPLLYFFIRESTGKIFYDENIFGIKNSVWFGLNFKAGWNHLDFLGMSQSIETISLRFGKNGSTSFDGYSKEYKMFVINMLRLASARIDIKELNKGVWELLEAPNSEIEDIISMTKNKWKYEILFVLLYFIIALGGMFGILILILKCLNFVDIYEKYGKYMGFISPILVLMALYVSTKIFKKIWDTIISKTKK